MESHEADTAASHSEGTETDETVCLLHGHAYHSYAYTYTFHQIPVNGTWHTRRSSDNTNSRPNSRWLGTCVHDVQVPKWVQKRKQVYPSEGEDVGTDDYEQPRRAVKVAVNMRFSLIAIGTHWYVDLGAGCVLPVS